MVNSKLVLVIALVAGLTSLFVAPAQALPPSAKAVVHLVIAMPEGYTISYIAVNQIQISEVDKLLQIARRKASNAYEQDYGSADRRSPYQRWLSAIARLERFRSTMSNETVYANHFSNLPYEVTEFDLDAALESSGLNLLEELSIFREGSFSTEDRAIIGRFKHLRISAGVTDSHGEFAARLTGIVDLPRLHQSELMSAPLFGFTVLSGELMSSPGQQMSARLTYARSDFSRLTEREYGLFRTALRGRGMRGQRCEDLFTP